MKRLLFIPLLFVLVGCDGCKPTPPTPPNPPPPVPDAGFRVLVVRESATPLTPAQRLILSDSTVRAYLDAHCVKENGQPGWRVFDPDTDMTAAAKPWQEMMKRPRASLPWVVISNGTTGFEGPLPATVDDFLVLARKYGGN